VRGQGGLKRVWKGRSSLCGLGVVGSEGVDLTDCPVRSVRGEQGKKRIRRTPPREEGF